VRVISLFTFQIAKVDPTMACVIKTRVKTLPGLLLVRVRASGTQTLSASVRAVPSGTMTPTLADKV
jgi:hypothetical protein